MANNYQTYCKDKLAKWLLAATLVMSVFAYSGYVGGASFQQRQGSKIELIVSVNSNNKKKVSFKKAFKCYHADNKYANFSKYEYSKVLLFHDRLFKTRFENNRRQIFCFNNYRRVFSTKTIPQNSNEEFLNSPRG